MTTNWISGRLAMLGVAMAVSAPLSIHTAEAARSRSHTAAAHASARAIQVGMGYSHSSRYAGGGHSVARYGRYSGARYGGALQCVPFARENSGIELSGNAANWWANAEGLYERGARPEVGSVLNFRANGRMHMGHVAVVSNVVSGRTVEIDHANWSGRGSITRNMTVVDVSERNDWSAVRVARGYAGDFGSVYPTYGFIYDRPDRGTMVANAGNAPAPLLNAAPRDLRPASERYAAIATEIEEVAEASDDVRPRSRRTAARHSRPVVVKVHAHGHALVRHSRRHNT